MKKMLDQQRCQDVRSSWQNKITIAGVKNNIFQIIHCCLPFPPQCTAINKKNKVKSHVLRQQLSLMINYTIINITANLFALCFATFTIGTFFR